MFCRHDSSNVFYSAINASLCRQLKYCAAFSYTIWYFFHGIAEKIKPEFEMIDDYEEYDEQKELQNSKEDDLLQIPAFLRRQAN